MLSRQTKEAIKTALAMTIAYGIALSMDWEKPLWAGFAVAFISLSTVGQSVQKGIMRMLGTVVAVLVALLLIALFPQERWWFMVALSAFVGLCTYMMDGKKYHYFWNVAGFVSAIICLEAGPDATSAFETALLRAEETGLGILVYSLVSVLLWPTTSLEDFNSAARQLTATQNRLFRSCLVRLGGRPVDEDVQSLRIEAIQAQGRFDQLLEAAVMDTFEVWEVREAWVHFQSRSTELMETLVGWSSKINDVQDIDMNSLLPTWRDLTEEINARFEQINLMLAGEAPNRTVQSITLSPETEEVQSLSHFQRAALTCTRNQVLQIEDLTRGLFASVQYLKGFSASELPVNQPEEPGLGLVLDLDRVTGAVRVMAGMWAAYLIWIYTEVPGGTTFVIMSAPFGMILATTPRLSSSLLILPVSASIAFAAFVYIFVMPEISSFAGLGLLIFAVTFAVCYMFSSPRQVLSRAFGLAMFVVVTAISNTQSYSFLSVANTSLMIALMLALLALVANVPVSPRPEKAFLRLLRRYFRSARFLSSQMIWEDGFTSTFWGRCKRAFYLYEMKSLPTKLEVLGATIDHGKFPTNSPEKVRALLTSLHILAYRVVQHVETTGSGSGVLSANNLLDDIGQWRTIIESTFGKWSDNPEPESAEVLNERLAARMGDLEDRIRGTIAERDAEIFGTEDSEHFYQLLADFRGVSKAAIAYAAVAYTVDWAEWREEVF